MGDGEEGVLLLQLFVDLRVDLPDVVPVCTLLALVHLLCCHCGSLPFARWSKMRAAGTDRREARRGVFVEAFHFISFIGVIIIYGDDAEPHRRRY